jgi:hypothetical protein
VSKTIRKIIVLYVLIHCHDFLGRNKKKSMDRDGKQKQCVPHRIENRKIRGQRHNLPV